MSRKKLSRWDPGSAFSRPKPGVCLDTPPDLPVSEWARKHLDFHPDPLQSQILDSNSDRLAVCCTRQWGKSTVAAVKALHMAHNTPGSLILFASASLKQSAELLRKLKSFAAVLTNKPHRGDGVHPASTVLPNGSRILALPQSPDTVRGYSGPKLIVIDEAAFVTNELFHAITPALAHSNGALWLLSSANGQTGFFYEAWHDGAAGWTRFTATAADCPRIRPDFLERERLIKGEAVYLREYFCEFQAGDDQLIDRALIEEAFLGGQPALHLRL